MLDAVVAYLPAPGETTWREHGDETQPEADPEGSPTARAFARSCRCCTPAPARPSASLACTKCMRTSTKRELLEAGDIAGIVGLKDTLTGQTLTGNSAAVRAHALVLVQITIPQPVIDVTIEPKTQADQQGLGKALHALVRTPDPARAAGRRVGPYDPVRHGRAAARGDGREAARAAPRERGCRSAAGDVLGDHRAC